MTTTATTAVAKSIGQVVDDNNNNNNNHNNNINNNNPSTHPLFSRCLKDLERQSSDLRDRVDEFTLEGTKEELVIIGRSLSSIGCELQPLRVTQTSTRRWGKDDLKTEMLRHEQLQRQLRVRLEELRRIQKALEEVVEVEEEGEEEEEEEEEEGAGRKGRKEAI